MTSSAPSARSTGPSSDLVRIVVVESCRLKASFNDGTIVLLSETADTFVVAQGEFRKSARGFFKLAASLTPATHTGSKISSQLTQYALSKHLPRLAVALEFRNLHLDQPYSHPKLQADADKFSSGACTYSLHTKP